MKYLLADVLNTWIRAVESERNELNVPYYSGLFERMNRRMTWDELKRCFEDIHGFLFRMPQANSRSQQFIEIVDYIHKHYDQELSIEYFAGMMNMSIDISVGPSRRRWVKICGIYREVPVDEGQAILLETDLKMDEIAEKVGYWGRNSLIRAFRRYEGITPAKYRNIHQ